MTRISLAMQRWQHASGRGFTVFYNAAADIYIQLWQRFTRKFSFDLGPGMQVREAFNDLSMGNGHLTSEGDQLLSQLKTSGGNKIPTTNAIPVMSGISKSRSQLVF